MKLVTVDRLSGLWDDLGMSTNYTTRIAGTESAPVVELLADGEVIGTAGGKRAARAAAVIVGAYDGADPGLFGLRADYDKAVAEARNLLESRRIRNAKPVAYTNPASFAIAVKVDR